MVFLLPLVLATLLFPAAALADGVPPAVPTSVAGVVADHTQGHGPLGGATVTLRIYKNQQFQRELQAKTDASGHYQFDGLSPDPAYQYIPEVQYEGVTYGGDAARLADAQAKPGYDDIAVYETTSQDPGLRYDDATLVIGGVSQATQHLSFLELLTLNNPSDRTFVPSAAAQGMATNLVRFALPAGVDDIGVQSGLDTASLIEVERGLASTLPVAPGAHTISFSFAVPYQGAGFNFAWNLIYPAAAVHVLEPTDGPPLTAGPLTAGAPLALQGHTFRVLSAGAVGANTTIPVALDHLPARTPIQALQAALPQSKAVPVAALIAALLAALVPVVYLWRRRPATRAARAPTADALLDELASLDDAHDRGEVEEGTYAERRAALKAQVARLLPAQAEPDG